MNRLFPLQSISDFYTALAQCLARGVDEVSCHVEVSSSLAMLLPACLPAWLTEVTISSDLSTVSNAPFMLKALSAL